MGWTKLDETQVFEISIKIDFFMHLLVIKTPFFRVSATIESGSSLLTDRYHELFEKGLL